MQIKQFLVEDILNYKILRQVFNEFYTSLLDEDQNKQIHFKIFFEVEDECISLDNLENTMDILEDCQYYATYYQILADSFLYNAHVKSILFLYKIENIDL